MSKTKKIISLLLAVALIMTMATVAIVSASAATKVYFDGTGWGSVNAYTYVSGGSSEGLGAWPGTACNDEGNGIWSIEIPDDCTHVIFNDGSNQTMDLVNPGATQIAKLTGNMVPGAFSDVCEAVWEDYAGGEATEATTAAVTEATTVAESEATTAAEAEATEATTEAPIAPGTSDAFVTTADAKTGDTVIYTADLTAAKLFENIQATVTYDATKLELVRVKSDDPDIEDWKVEGPAYCPNLANGIVLNAGTPGAVDFNASNIQGYNFKNGAVLITLEFKAIADGATDIALAVEEMTMTSGDSYFSDGVAVTTDGIEFAVAADVKGEGTTAGTTASDATGIIVAGKTYQVPAGTKVTYVVDLTAAKLFENIQATVTYDATKLQLNRVKSDDPDIEDWKVEGPAYCPNLANGIVLNAATAGVVDFNASNIQGYNFKNKLDLITLEFTVLDTAETEIVFSIQEMTMTSGDSYFSNGDAVVTDGIEIDEYLIVPDIPTEGTTAGETEVTTAAETEATTAAETEATTVAETEATTAAETEATEATTATGTEPAPTEASDATSATEGTEKPADVVTTGAASYIYVVLAVLSLAACAVVVLRKKVNG
ncbi:MAG: starch-binding protein [Ruminococcus sp.]